MLKIYTLILIALSTSILACAPITRTPSNNAARYLQFRSPINQVVGLQLTFPNGAGCDSALKVIIKNDSNNDLQGMLNCTENSSAQTLPFRATTRNIAYGFLVDVESITIFECKELVDGLSKIPEGQNVEIVSPCQKK
jgi:hypothetical protein